MSGRGFSVTALACAVAAFAAGPIAAQSPPAGWTYWGPGQPNDALDINNERQDRIHFWTDAFPARVWTWNDLAELRPVPGYVMEWEGPAPPVPTLPPLPLVLLAIVLVAGMAIWHRATGAARWSLRG